MSIPFNPRAREAQEILKARGYTLGVSGPARDGVDGIAGDRTWGAILLELRKGEAAMTAPPIEALKPRPPGAVGEPNSWQRMIDLPLLKLAFPTNNEAGLAPWVEPTRAACIRWGIDLPREIASFLANISVESADLRRLSESLNYSVQGLLETFGRHRISVDQAQRYGRAGNRPADQEALANILYGGAFGREQLGNTEPGDGWKCRGFGPKQVTGRANQQDFADAVGMTLEEAQAFMRTPEGGMIAAGWFWKTRNLDAKAATPGIEDDRKAINGGLNGVTEVDEAFRRVIAELLRREGAGR